ncbi:MAG: hypothetical protein ACR2HH_16770 [Chthoniobacterales bacterium]
MKIFARLLPFFCLLIASVAWAGSVPSMEVKVSNASGKVVYQGSTKADGSFTTGNLAPGNYTVLFLSKGGKGGPYDLEASAGQARMSANAVAGNRFSDPGIAMRLKVASSMPMTGRVGPAGSVAKAKTTTTIAAASSKGRDDAPTKMINGKRYIWVRPQTSSMEGGHWVEEGSKDDVQTGSKLGATPPPHRSELSGRGY